MNIELSKEQIAMLFTFVEKKGVRYKDVQYELVDHLASAIEEDMNADKNLNFEAALKSVYSKFPITGFDKFLREKEKAMLSYWRRKIGSITMLYLSLPKLVMTVTLSLLYGFIASIQSKWSFDLCIFISSIGLLYIIITSSLISKNHVKKYLVLNKFTQATSGFIFFPLGVSPYLNDIVPNASLSYTDWQIYFVVVFCTLSTVMVHASVFEFPKIIKQEIENKYAHLGIRLI